MEPTDADLVRAIAARGDADAERELASRLGSRVLAVATRRVRDPARAEDVTQEALTRTFEALRRGAVRDPEALAPFVVGIVKNLALDGARKHARERAALERLPSPGSSTIPVLDVRRGRLEDCLSTLAQRERNLLRMTFWEQASPSEITDALSITAENARVMRHRLMHRLRVCLERARLEIAR